MLRAIIHFFAGALASLVVSLVFTRLSGVGRFSLPSDVVIVGLACASLSHFASPWATPVVLLLYALTAAAEYRRSRADLEGAAGKEKGARE